MREAYYAGGCFWCITPCFYEMDGVESVASTAYDIVKRYVEGKQ